MQTTTLIPNMTNRKHWADVCRTIAIFFVIIIHSCGILFSNQDIAQGTWRWQSLNFFDSLARCSVPLFVMLSGALLLNPSKLKTSSDIIHLSTLIKRIQKIIIPTLFWSLFYLIHSHLYTPNSSISNLPLLSILTTPSAYHLWFMYMMLGVYLLLPFLQWLFMLLLSRKDLQCYFFTLFLLISSLPHYYPPLTNFSNLLLQSSFLGGGSYFLIGALLVHNQTPKEKQFSQFTLLSIYIIFVLITMGITNYLSKQAGHFVDTAYEYSSLNVVIASMAIFTFFSRLKGFSISRQNPADHPQSKQASKIRIFFSITSHYTFAIYFIHAIVLDYFANSVTIKALSAQLMMPINILFISLVTFIISFLLAFLLRLIPKSSSFIG